MPWKSSRSRRHITMSDCPSRTPVAPEYSVRDAEATDVDVLVSFTLQEAREAEGYDADEAAVRRGVGAAFIDAPQSRYWVGECDGEPVASVSVVTEWSKLPRWRLLVDPEHLHPARAPGQRPDRKADRRGSHGSEDLRCTGPAAVRARFQLPRAAGVSAIWLRVGSVRHDEDGPEDRLLCRCLEA